MRVRKTDRLILKKSMEFELPKSDKRVILTPGTKLFVGRQNSRYVYLYTDGGTGINMALECRVLAREVRRDNFRKEVPESRSKVHKRLFGEIA